MLRAKHCSHFAMPCKWSTNTTWSEEALAGKRLIALAKPQREVTPHTEKQVNRLASRLTHVLELLLAVNLLIISIIVVAQVVLRYCFSSSITSANETITILFIYMSSVGAAVAMGRRAHITIPMAIDLLPRRMRRVVDSLGVAAVAVVNVLLAGYSIGWIRVTGSYVMPTTELPRVVAQASVPIGCTLAALFCVALLCGANIKAPELPVQGDERQR